MLRKKEGIAASPPSGYPCFLTFTLLVSMLMLYMLEWLPIELMYVFGVALVCISVRDYLEWMQQGQSWEAQQAAQQQARLAMTQQQRYEEEIQLEIERLEQEETKALVQEQMLKNKALLAYFADKDVSKASSKILDRAKSFTGRFNVPRSAPSTPERSKCPSTASTPSGPHSLPPPRVLPPPGPTSTASDGTEQTSRGDASAVPSTPRASKSSAATAEPLSPSTSRLALSADAPPPRTLSRATTAPPVRVQQQQTTGHEGSRQGDASSCASPSARQALDARLLKAASPDAVRRELKGTLGYSSGLSYA